ncbi:GLPGLI family protein [Gillisia hiemivivida]|uniref:GLPGLI family protein n=1 Tax=Gillisia hiemivivida TaxID=291190 RepID=A0A5C6ZX91_9FLAO|nr:GLPGLI family protein [Gillisia hiemivivida]TXD94902.1 GLPGLI family protein [Gillisia hiemivivida]
MRLFYIAFLSFFMTYGQKDDSSFVLEYEVNYQLGKALVKEGYVFKYEQGVHYYTSKSVFLEESKKFYVDEETGIPNINLRSAGDGSNHNITYLNKNIHIGLYSLGNQLITTTEELILQNWKATGEEETINGRSCVKLVTSYRGRDYIAYVDLSVPVNFGPWKFNNFPGLPVLVKDTENKLSWTLSKIKYEDVAKLKKFTIEQKQYLGSLKSIPLEEYVDIYDSSKGGFDLMVSKLPREFKRQGSGKMKQRKGLEIEFEWEEKQ